MTLRVRAVYVGVRKRLTEAKGLEGKEMTKTRMVYVLRSIEG